MYHLPRWHRASRETHNIIRHRNLALGHTVEQRAVKDEAGVERGAAPFDNRHIVRGVGFRNDSERPVLYLVEADPEVTGCTL